MSKFTKWSDFKDNFYTGDGKVAKMWQRFGDPLMAKVLVKPKTPELTAPAVMPDTDDEQVKAARRRQIAEIQSRSGRASTILTGGGDQLGG